MSHWIGFGVEDKQVYRLTRWPRGRLRELRLAQLVFKGRLALLAPRGGDLPKRVSASDFRENLRQIVALARQHGIVPVLPDGRLILVRQFRYLVQRWSEEFPCGGMARGVDTAAHSGAIAGRDDAYQALFDRYGVQRVQDMDELATALMMFAQPHPIAVWPEGYEPSLRNASSSSGVHTGVSLTIKGRSLAWAFLAE